MCECFCSSNDMLKETLITVCLLAADITLSCVKLRYVTVLTAHNKFRMEITKFAFLTYGFMVLETCHCYCYFYYINITIIAIIIYLFFLRCYNSYRIYLRILPQ